MHVLIVGAGIMGLATARALARRGVRVDVYDQGFIPNPSASSFDAHRLIRMAYGDREGYALMVREAYRSWDRLWEDLGVRLYRPTGTLILGGASSPWVMASVDLMTRLGYSPRPLGRDAVRKQFPPLNDAAFEAAVFFPEGGVLLADRILEHLALRAPTWGACLHPHRRVVDLDPETATLRLAGGHRQRGDVIVLTAGPWVNRLFSPPPFVVQPTRQIVCYLAPPAALQPFWASAPMMLDIDPDRGFYLIPPVAGTPMKVGDHRFGMTADPDASRAATGAEADAVIRLARSRLRDFGAYRVLKARACYYAVSPDERFQVRRQGRAWIMTGFSGHGFKFAPLLGERLAEQITQDGDAAGFTRWCAGFVPPDF